MDWEFTVLDYIAANFRTEVLNQIMIIVTNMNTPLWILVSVLLICSKRYRSIGLATLLALFAANCFGNHLLKPLIARERPFIVRPDIVLLIAPPGGYSFPSGHAFSSFAASTALYCGFGAKASPAIILAVIIAFSRLYLYVHFPTDVLAGAGLGILTGIIAVQFIQMAKHNTLSFGKGGA